jgi:hypothetical protein
MLDFVCQEHYWKNEAEMTTDWTSARDTADYIETVRHMKEIVETWQAIMLYSSAGLTTFAEIPDLNLRSVGITVYYKIYMCQNVSEWNFVLQDNKNMSYDNLVGDI